MRPIVPNLHTLIQYLAIFPDINLLRPDCCPHCRHPHLHGHGSYGRQADRFSPAHASLNAILIRRFRCPKCGRTCSTLPECIPPRRWYSWALQQAMLTFILNDCSVRQASQAAPKRQPARSTITRWWQALHEQFIRHSDALRARCSFLGRTTHIIDFWLSCFGRMRLSRAMFLLNAAGIFVP